MDVFDEIEDTPKTDVFDEVAPEKLDIFDEIAAEKPVIRQAVPGSVAPQDLLPAVRKIGGSITEGQPGDTHPDIIDRENIPATEIDQRGFTGPNGEFYDRETAGIATGLPTYREPGRLHSTDLMTPEAQQLTIKTPRMPPSGEMSTIYGGPRKPLASAAETMVEPMEALTTPRVTTPKFEVKKDDSIPTAIGKEAWNIATSIPEFLSSNAGVLSLVSGSVAPTVTMAAFTADMLASLGNQVVSTYKNWDQMSEAQKAAAITDMVGTGAMAALMAKGTAKGIRAKIEPKAEAVIPEVAPEVPKPAEPVPEGTPIQTLSDALEKGTGTQRIEAREAAGKSARTLDDLEALANLRDKYRPAKKPTTPQEAQAAASNAVLSQIPGEAIQIAVNLRKQPGSGALDWQSNPEVAKWLVDNADRLGLANHPDMPAIREMVAKPAAPTPAEPAAPVAPEVAPTIAKWKKVASVSPGGKPYFNNAYDAQGIKIGTVVWDRIDNEWKSTDRSGKELGTAKSAKDGMSQLPSLLKTSPQIVGLGAAEKGEPPVGTQIDQLIQAFKGVQEKAAPLGEQIKEAFSVGDRLSAAQDSLGKALSGMKTAGDYIINKWKGIPNIDDLLRAKKVLSRDIESRGWRLNQWEKQARRSIPNPRDQAAIAKWIDAGGDRATLERGLAEAPQQYKRAYQDALNLSGDKLISAQNAQNYFEARLQEAIDAGVLEHGIDNYIHRMYESKPALLKRAMAYTQSGLLKTNPALAKKRVFQFDWEAEKAGFKPVQSFVKRITAYEASLSKAIAAREFIKSASEMKAADGRPVIDIKGVGIPVEGETGAKEATLIKPKFNPAKNNEPTLPNGNPNPNYRGDYVNRDYRALSRWKWVGEDAGGKPILIQGDVAIHPDYAGRVDALLKPSQVRYGKFGAALRPALAVSSTIKQTMLDLSGFHPVQITVHGLEHRVLPWKIIRDIDLSHPDVDGLLKGGVTLGGDYSGIHREGLVGASLTRKIPGLGPQMESYHQWLFQDYIPRIKMTMALHDLQRNRARYAGQLTEEQIFHRTASEANAAFGELNYTVLERSKTAQDMARLIMLAPDFLEARGRFAAQAFQKGGKSFGNEQRTALLLGAMTMYVTARIANKLIDGQYHNEPENLFNIVKDGHAYGLRTVQGDILHLVTKPMQFIMSRLNPVYGRTLLEALTGRDYFGRKRSAAEQAWDAASTTIPISLRSNRERTIWESLANGFGATARRYSEVDDAFKLAQKWKDKNAIPERGEFIYDPEKDVLRPLKLALNHGDEVGAAAEIKKLLDSKVYTLKKLDEYFKRYGSMPFTGSKANDKKFVQSLTADQRATVEAARQHKNEIRKLYLKSKGQYLAPPSAL